MLTVPPDGFVGWTTRNASGAGVTVTLANRRTRIVYVRVPVLVQPPQEEEWLRANAVVFGETHLGVSKIVEFRPRDGETF